MNLIADKEKEKYETVWTELPGYRDYSPAEQLSDSAISLFRERDVKSILDAGCGTGRATAGFLKSGFDAIGVDITLKAIDKEIYTKHTGIFFECSLWELPKEWPPFDGVFCIDVMEHIPPEKVDETLLMLSGLCKKAAVFNIALFKDGFGKEIGESLHLSLFSADEWEKRVSEHFINIKRTKENQHYVTFICEPKIKELSRKQVHKEAH